MGVRVIVCDQNPTCPGRVHADHYIQVSTIDVAAIRRIAIEYQADGISAYASDPAALTAALVTESLSLPGNASDVVRTISRKDLLREFLREHHFAVPDSVGCDDLRSFHLAVKRVGVPCIVKPVDSSGSKGVTIACSSDDADETWRKARRASTSGRVIVEELIRRRGPQIAGDGFIQDGKLSFVCLGEETFDACANPLAPVGECFPLNQETHLIRKVRNELERFVESSGLRTGSINFDVVVDEGAAVYLIDVGARAGGNGIPELLRYHTGTDLLECSILAALGERISKDAFAKTACGLCHASYVIHSRVSGRLRGITVHDSIKRNILDLRIFEEKLGEHVRAFTDSSDSIGYALLRFETQLQMRGIVKTLSELIRADVRH